MATLSGPLFSLKASGSVGDALTIATRKRKSVARAYTAPADPQSTDQLAQRSLISGASDLISQTKLELTYSWSPADVAAYNRLAKALGRTCTWHNQIVSNCVAVALSGNIPTVFRHHRVTWAAPNYRLRVFSPLVNGVDITAATCYYGPSPTKLIYSQACTLSPAFDHCYTNVSPVNLTDPFYFQMRVDPGQNCAGVVSGIHMSSKF